MTDRSFGDHPNRNVVKNPLLSTAVTGLSLEDLTHNAVLLPVSLSQEVITRPEYGTQSQALGNTSRVTPSFPSGDSNSNITILHQHPSPHSNIITNVQPNKKTEKPNENVCSTQSKASMKTEDDFDVNEYFARLQGTRYVSAPLNSGLKEDTNANLQQSEENLEEINLNEPQAETQQSITSDIAQNFSQLPTVLPQVASAVFSSFSNMLSMKSREQTPDAQMQPSGHEVQIESRDVPLMVSESRMEAPPPPLKEPPPVGTGNYRLASAKKKYAQIPGLTSGDIAHNAMPAYNPMSQNVPSYFTPGHQDANTQEARTDASGFVPTDMQADKKEQSYNIFTPIDNEQTQSQSNFAQNQHNLSQASQVFNEPPKLPPPQPNVPIIPPPPMFSNTQTRDNQTGVEKTILPPSVARRIAGKQQASVPACPEHIFVPPPAFENAGASSDASGLSFASPSLDLKPPSDSEPSSIPTVFASSGNSSTSLHSSVSVPGILSIQQPPLITSVGMGIASGTLPPPPSAVTSISTSSVPSSVSIFTPVESPRSEENIPPPAMFNLSSQANETTIMAPAPSFFNPAEMEKVPSAMPQPSFFNPVEVSKEVISTNTSSSSFAPPPFSIPTLNSQPSSIPPTYFNPSIPEQPKEFKPDSNVHQNSSQYFGAGTSAEPPKPLPEPPKATGNVNFRMAKKRPQYYSGPIVGVGSISNNVKPVIEPVEGNAFQGGIFVPQAQEATEQLPNSNVETPVPFNISRPPHNPQYSQPEQSFVQEYKTDTQPQYNTAFDLSRPSTDNYEPPKEENKGFGFIGSLKSKLTSLDINKIQSSVTTFFDPAYNDTKKDDSVTKQSAPYEHQPVGQYPQGQSSFEIFVPSIQPAHQYSQIYDCQMSFQDQQNQQQYYQAPDSQNYYQNKGARVYNAPNYPTYNMLAPQENVSQTYLASCTTNLSGSVAPASQFTNTEQNLPSVSVRTQETYQSSQNVNTEADSVRSIIMPQQADQSSQTKTPAISNDTTQTEQGNVRFVFKDNKDHFPEASGTKPFFGSYPNQTGNAQGNIFESLQTLQKQDDDDLTVKKEIQKIAQNILATEESPEHFFDHKMSNVHDFPHKSFKENNDQSMYSLDKSAKDTPNPMSNDDNASKPQEETYLENEMRKMSLSEVLENVNAEFTHSCNGSSKESSETKENTPRDVSELSICETCREFDKPEDRDVEDLTTQLIENITSPIQLLNPVEVPLTESDLPINITENFNTDQCADISHIIEDTIETIHVQSVVELLKDEDVADARNYGWNTEKTNLTTVNVTAQDSNVPNPNAIGFFGGDSLFTDNNMPKNASDEIKAEFKFTHDEPVLLTRQMSIPTAPPAEDIKLEETGIDVHSIELDAKNDFPIYEEFVIEPSETDDDKIECKERRKSSEEIKDIDSFTNRVERFKKMGEKETDLQKSSFSLSSTSPSLPIASYFDTGNYAAETHYRNSLTSPPNVSSLITVSPNQVTVPPGFEDVYKRKLSGMQSQDASSVPYILECCTDTRPTYSPTFQTVKVTSVTTASIVTPQQSHFETKPAIPPLPHFQSTFCYNLETNQQPFILKSTNPEDHSTQPQDVSRVMNPLDKQTDADLDLRQVPNCGTQTKPIFSPTFSTARTQSSDISMAQQASSSRPVTDFQNPISNLKEAPNDAKEDTPLLPTDADKNEIPRTHSRTPRKPVESRNMPILANIFGVNDEPQAVHPIPKHQNSSKQDSNKPQLPSRLPAFSNIFDTQKDSIGKIEAPSLFQASDDDVLNEPKPLPDPINFFSPSVDSAAPSTSNDDSSTNRLASYFSSPAKNDSSKSFFELSQGQDHYRQENRLLASGDSKTVTAPQKSLFELSQSQSRPIDTNTHLQNIPPEKYLANFNLMKDLTSVQNIEVSSDQVLKTVNYFTVQYNYENLPNEFDKGEPESSKNTKDHAKEEETGDSNAKVKRDELNQNVTNTEFLVYDDKTAYEIVNSCRNCCNMNVGCVKKYDYLKHEAVIGKEFKVKKSMDNNTDSRKEADDPNMAQRSVTHDKDSVTVNFGNAPLKSENDEKDSTLDEKQIATEYVPVKHHWFYRIDVDGKSIWRGFSLQDSKSLEEAYLSPNLTEQTLVPTDGGRYDVNVIGRLRISVYWSEKPSNVMRCSWFYKGTTDARYVPYTEPVAEKLEEEYRHGITTGVWHRRLTLPNNEVVIMHGPAVMVHFLQSSAADSFGSAVSQPTQLSQLLLFGKRVYRNPPKIRVCRDQPLLIDHLLFMVHGAGEYSNQRERTQSTMRPRVVRRGHEETEIEDIEPSNIDHLLLLCHGVGSACDIRFRNVEEVVDDFRTTSLQLVQSHYKNSCDAGVVGRVEVLPISWHATLHSGETGVDRRLSRITLDSIPRLRNFTNDTVLDVLFYTSPVFCQTIINTVCAELNRIYKLFLSRNPGYKGGVSLGGHSLGSVILFDLLCHQPREKSQKSQKSVPCSPDKTYVTGCAPDNAYVMGTAGTGQPVVKYPKLDFHPVALYALGSPIAIFECIRGVDALGSDFCLPTCRNFFNIFHPYDPIAYRIEPLINAEMRKVKPFLIPHHKGRKRMHLELKDTMARVGADIKQKLVESIRTTWASMWKTQTPPTDRQLEKVVEEEIEKEQLNEAAKEEGQDELVPTPEMLGRLNNGRRIDYVLQEAPLEVINEYLFAMSSHVCYWESEDTMLLILREIYDQLGVQPDSTVPPPSMTVQRTRTAKEIYDQLGIQPDSTVPPPSMTVQRTRTAKEDEALLSQEHPSTSRQIT